MEKKIVVLCGLMTSVVFIVVGMGKYTTIKNDNSILSDQLSRIRGSTACPSQARTTQSDCTAAGYQSCSLPPPACGVCYWNCNAFTGIYPANGTGFVGWSVTTSCQSAGATRIEQNCVEVIIIGPPYYDLCECQGTVVTRSAPCNAGNTRTWQGC